MKDLYTFGVLLQLIAIVVSQRVAPGVNPQHYQQNQQYQQPPPHQGQGNPQYQQQQQYQQQPPVHQQQQHAQHGQQVPVQQQQQAGQVPQAHHQVPQGQQQVPQGQHLQQQQASHGHGHGGHGGHNAPVLSGNVQAEKEHIAEHMDVPMDTSKMSEQELQFHYFKMHDADNNNKLDGCELIKSLIHWHDEKDAENPEITFLTDEELSTAVDSAFEIFDKDDDGIISYYEYKLQHAHEAAKVLKEEEEAAAATSSGAPTQPSEGDNLDAASQYIYPDSQLGELIDISLKMDKNKDGFVDFGEYKNAEETFSSSNK